MAVLSRPPPRAAGRHARTGRAAAALLVLERPGRAWAALLVGIALVWVALQRVTLGLRPTFLGKDYAQLALDPFHPSADNPVGHRLLAPLVSWAMGLRGPYLLYMNLLATVVLLGAVYLWFRGRGHAPTWAVYGASIAALSMVALTTLHYGGYPDAFTYLLVFGAWLVRRHPAAAAALFLAAMLAHESALFLAPWLGIEIARATGGAHRGWRAAAAVGAAVVAFSAARVALEAWHPGVSYTFRFYATPLLHDPLHWFRESAGSRGLGIAAAFDLYWLFPALAAARMWVRGHRADAVVLLMPVACALAQLVIAYDTTRMATLAFPSVLLGAEYLLRVDGWAARRWALPLALANFFLPQVNVAMGIVDRMGR